MQRLSKTISAFLTAYSDFSIKFQLCFPDPETRDEIIDKLSEEFALDNRRPFMQDMGLIVLLATDPGLLHVIRKLNESVQKPIKKLQKDISTAKGHIPQACREVSKDFVTSIHQDYNLERIKNFEKRVFKKLHDVEKKHLLRSLPSHLENLGMYEKALKAAVQRKKVLDVSLYMGMLSYLEITEAFIVNIAPDLQSIIATTTEEIEKQKNLTPIATDDRELTKRFYKAIAVEVAKQMSWPKAPVESVQAALSEVSAEFTNLMPHVVGASTRSNQELYEGIPAFKGAFLPTYEAFSQALPLLSAVAPHIAEEQVAILMNAWQGEVNNAVFSHQDVATTLEQARDEYLHRRDEYIAALEALSKNLQDVKTRAETWLRDCGTLTTNIFPVLRAQVFRQMAVSLKFQHVRNGASALQDPKGDLSKIDKELNKKILLTFLHTGRSRDLFSRLKRHGAVIKEKEEHINKFIQSFSVAANVADLAGVFKILDDADNNAVLMNYRHWLGINPIGRISESKQLIHDLRIELERIIERENATHAMQKSIEATIREEEALLFQPDVAVFNFERTFDDFLVTFKDAFAAVPEMAKLREAMIGIYCWPLAEESKLIRMHIALTHLSSEFLALPADKHAQQALAIQLTGFAARHYPSAMTKKDEFAFSCSREVFRSFLFTVVTGRRETLLSLYRTVDHIALLEMNEQGKIKEMQRVVASFVRDIRHSTRGSPGWKLFGRNGSKLAEKLEGFMRTEWQLDVQKTLAELEAQPEQPSFNSSLSF
jgi:hypothetical protein